MRRGGGGAVLEVGVGIGVVVIVLRMVSFVERDFLCVKVSERLSREAL